ncbi:DUF2914 domain-containing protein [Marinobacter nanhaiticus]|nr:DUF2914 domain-containing protein [Marinobacter nanhaiticus]
MNRSDKSSHNLKMRAGTRREPRVEETVVYHWGRILGAVVSLLLIAFLVYWFFSASPGTSVGDSNDPVSPEAEDPGMGTSVSGTVQRSATEPAPGAETTPTESTGIGEPAEHASPFAADAPQLSDSSPAEGSNGLAANDQTGTGQADSSPVDASEVDSGQSTLPDDGDTAAAAAQVDTGPVAETEPESAPETTSLPPESVIDDPADRPAPTDDPEPTSTTADVGPEAGENGMAQLDIASGHLQRVQLTWEVRDREPTSALPAVINLGSREVIRVYFFNELQGLKGQTVYHDWYLNGERVARVNIDAFLDRMRASSGKYINQAMLGEWRVEAVTDSGTVLGSGTFSVTQ